MNSKARLSRFAAKERVSYLTSWSCSLISLWQGFCISNMAIMINETNIAGWTQAAAGVTSTDNFPKCILATFSPHSQICELNNTFYLITLKSWSNGAMGVASDWTENHICSISWPFNVCLQRSLMFTDIPPPKCQIITAGPPVSSCESTLNPSPHLNKVV